MAEEGLHRGRIHREGRRGVRRVVEVHMQGVTLAYVKSVGPQ